MNPADIHASSPLPSPGFDRYEFSRSKHAEDQDDIEPIPFQSNQWLKRGRDAWISAAQHATMYATILLFGSYFDFVGNWPSLKFELHGVIHYFIS